MGYGSFVHEKAEEELKKRRKKAEYDLEQRHGEVASKYPDLLRIENGIAKTGLSASKALADGTDIKKALGKIAKQNLALQMERDCLLEMAKLPKDYLEPKYICPTCKDEGYVGGKICSCHKKLLKEIALSELQKVSPLSESTFESFDLNYYPNGKDENTGISPRSRMMEIFKFCKSYAEDFGAHSPSLFMYGETGLGKTHLSLAIAQKAVEKGFGIIYGSAQNLLNELENERFGRDGKERGSKEREILGCDLLILDDLGAEFSTSFTVAAIYNIVNTRLLSNKPVIISTNLSAKELEEKYTRRITSRIMGNYVPLRFCGRDIRQLKQLKKMEAD